MKRPIIYILFLSFCIAVAACVKDSFPGAEVSPYISIFDLRDIYKGSDVTLTTKNMGGSDSITGVVVSDHSGDNLPDGLLMLQDSRRLGKTRGIAVDIGTDADDYTLGDSVVINVKGGLLKRVNGLLEITGLSGGNVSKRATGIQLPLNKTTIAQILADPDAYECTQTIIVKGGPDPLPASPEKLEGDRQINDGFGDIILHTSSNATFKDSLMPVSGNFYSVVLDSVSSDGALRPYLCLRTGKDITTLSSTVNVTPIVISGFLNNAGNELDNKGDGTDADYEYIQFKATRDIDFSITPFSVVTTNNAGASTPTGYPTQGWATSGLRTYKINLTSGKAAKGTFFYVGGDTKLVDSKNSASMASLNWIRAFDYSKTAGDGFGTATGNLLSNSGNAYGIAVFRGTQVTVDSIPLDVIFISSGGSLYSNSVGYRVANTDFYDIIDPLSLQSQPFYHEGTNTLNIPYNNAPGQFSMLGGVYDTNLGRWTTARTLTLVQLASTSPVSMIESDTASTMIK